MLCFDGYIKIEVMSSFVQDVCLEYNTRWMYREGKKSLLYFGFTAAWYRQNSVSACRNLKRQGLGRVAEAGDRGCLCIGQQDHASQLINDKLGNLKAENGQKGIRLHPEKIIPEDFLPDMDCGGR
jgi:hypothetical protein